VGIGYCPKETFNGQRAQGCFPQKFFFSFSFNIRSPSNHDIFNFVICIDLHIFRDFLLFLFLHLFAIIFIVVDFG